MTEAQLEVLSNRDLKGSSEPLAAPASAGYGMGSFLLLGMVALGAGAAYAKFSGNSDAKSA